MTTTTGTGTLSYTPTIIGINGSTRTSGMCANALDRALAEARKYGAKTKIYHLEDTLKTGYTGHKGKFNHVPDDDFKEIADDLNKAEGMIIATPVNWTNPSPHTVNLLCKLTALEMRNYDLEGMAVGCIATQDIEGGWQVTNAVLGPLVHQGAVVPPYGATFYNRSLSRHWKHGKWMRDAVPRVGRNVAIYARMAAQAEPVWSGDKDFRNQDFSSNTDASYELKPAKRAKNYKPRTRK